MARPAPPVVDGSSIEAVIASIADLDADQLRLQWRNHLGGTPPAHLPRWLLARVLAQRIQIAALGDLSKPARRVIRLGHGDNGDNSVVRPFVARDPATRDGVGLMAGALLVREWNGVLQRVMVLESGFAWNGHRFFGLRSARGNEGAARKEGVARKVGVTGSDVAREAAVAGTRNAVAGNDKAAVALGRPGEPGVGMARASSLGVARQDPGRRSVVSP